MSDCAVFYARVLGGKPKFPDPARLSRLLAALEGEEIDVLIRKHRKGRSLKQNGYLWFMYDFIAQRVAGHTKDSIHQAMGQMFRTDFSGKLPVVKSTTDMSTVEMTEYWEKIWQFSAETLDIVVPDPNSEEALQWSKTNG